MKIRQRPSKPARIEIIPMIDVIFFLLVFFMLTSTTKKPIHTIPIQLPKIATGSKILDQKIILYIDKNGSLFINQTPTTLETLGSELKYAMREQPQETVIVNADEHAPYGCVIQAMHQAKQIGVHKFALSTEIKNIKKSPP